MSAGLVACSGAPPSAPATFAPPSASPPFATASPDAGIAGATTQPASSPLCPTAIVGEVDPDKVVLATANIWNAGHVVPRAPSGNGAGTTPPAWRLPPGTSRVISISDAAGCVTWGGFGDEPYNGPAGNPYTDPTHMNAVGGISGIAHDGNRMFVVGVFLTDAEPEDPAPPTLDFTNNEDFETLEPEIAQLFFVGDGVGKRFVAPHDATRLFLGFADAWLVTGDPGYYGNNKGQVQLTVTITVE